MGEVERRRGYGYNRVLIESERILDPEFNDAVVFLSGAQIEMLRNVTQYLNRLGTYAAEYNSGYYLVPTDEDFDDILEIVADMEEALMGNPNTIWGYKDIYSYFAKVEYEVTGIQTLQSGVVPAGYVYVINSALGYFISGTVESVVISKVTDAGVYEMARDGAPTVDIPLSLYGAYPLKEDNRIRIAWDIITEPCYVYIWLTGYMMKVPE